METPLTPEEKKAKAEAAKAELKAKATAEATLKKQNAEDEAAKKKQADAAAKAATATATVTEKFTELKTHTDAGHAVLAALVDTSTAAQVTEAETTAQVSLKAARESLKLIKATVKKLKEPGDLEQAVKMADDLVTGLDTAVKAVKSKISDAKKADKEAEKLKAKELKDAEKAKNAMPSANGITRPRPDTACGKAWALMDELSAKLKQPVPVAILLKVSETKDLNYDTVKTQYARWKKYNGIEGRVAIPLPDVLTD